MVASKRYLPTNMYRSMEIDQLEQKQSREAVQVECFTKYKLINGITISHLYLYTHTYIARERK